MALMNKCPFCMATVATAAATCEYCGSSISTGTCYSCKKPNAPGATVCASCGGKYLVGVEPQFVPTVKEKPAHVPDKGIHAGRPQEFPELAPAQRAEIAAMLAKDEPQPEPDGPDEPEEEPDEELEERREEGQEEDQEEEQPAEPDGENPEPAPAAPPPVPRKAVMPKGYEKMSEKLDDDNGLPVAVRCQGDNSEMVMVPASAFVMGAPDDEGEGDEHPRREVWLEAFYIDKHKVTVAQFRKFCTIMRREMREQPPWSTDAHPVVNVSWYDAAAYCEWAGKLLPTEAQWEKSARSGTSTKYNSGDSEKGQEERAWYAANSGRQAHPNGGKNPNNYGLYDMPGNTLEWCQDGYEEDYYGHAPDMDPRGSDSASVLVCRGAAWNLDAGYLRCARRGSRPPDHKADNIGFRCVSVYLPTLNPLTKEAPAEKPAAEEEEYED